MSGIVRNFNNRFIDNPIKTSGGYESVSLYDSPYGDFSKRQEQGRLSLGVFTKEFQPTNVLSELNQIVPPLRMWAAASS